MLPNLTAIEARIIGCLMEKSIVTPDQYPLTLNALTNACNQKSSRNPVMALEQNVVQHTTRDLADKHFVRVEMNHKNGMEKYLQRICNTQLSDYQFDKPQFAIICLLLLRGPQTPGELRTRCGRLHSFADNADVVTALTTLTELEGSPLAVKLPLTPGRRDAEYMHLLSGPIDVAAHASQASAAKTSNSTQRVNVPDLEKRVSQLEAEVADLKEQISKSS